MAVMKRGRENETVVHVCCVTSENPQKMSLRHTGRCRTTPVTAGIVQRAILASLDAVNLKSRATEKSRTSPDRSTSDP